MMKKVATAVNNDDQYPKTTVAVIKNGTTTQYCGIVKEKGRVGCKISRTGREEDCKLKKNEKFQKNGRFLVVMDHCKKMQCWVMLKRLMTGRDSWIFKEPLMGLEIIDKDYSFNGSSMSKPFIKSEIVCNNETLMKPTCLKDIESKLNKLLYNKPDEFADDIRVVLSYGLLHPPRSDIYKIARRVSEDFEVSWKALKCKWFSGEIKGKKI
ncbi:putative chromatin remodeler Bromodomain family [Lupinus albus]|uniref:Putative chromatin remodeler Bromodomain family n=1 Tax=Lupinus albus TaxID=3870 RepID=A0A6A4MSV8_LUPAL|nr:putative chromatin remodeler Bromodomain family [Lupinus albus]